MRISTSSFPRIHSLPVALPQMELYQTDSIVVAQYKLLAGQVLKIRFLSMQLLGISAGTPTKVTDSMGSVYLGVFAGGQHELRKPTGTPIFSINLSTPSAKVLNPNIKREFSGPDVITFVAVNNMTTLTAEIMVSGNVLLYS